VRDDYQVLVGTNRHTIVPSGWVHEEENYKVRLDGQGEIAGGLPFLAKELGVNRYERIVDFDFSAGDDYWQQTSRYWEDARAVWSELFSAADQHTIVESANGVPLFAVLFEQAETLSDDADYDSEEVRQKIRTALMPYFQ
jgi:hypothetical protein